MVHFYSFIICLRLRHEYSMTFLPIFGNLRKMDALDCGMISFMNEKSKFLDSLMDKDVGLSPVAFHFFSSFF